MGGARVNFLFQGSLKFFHATSVQKFSIKVWLKIFWQGPAIFFQSRSAWIFSIKIRLQIFWESERYHKAPTIIFWRFSEPLLTSPARRPPRSVAAARRIGAEWGERSGCVAWSRGFLKECSKCCPGLFPRHDL